MRRLSSMLAGVVLSFVLASCTHKELCQLHPHTMSVRVAFDWGEAPDATPAGMCVFFYPEDGGQPRRFDFRGIDGGVVNLTVGRYKALCYNNDTESTLFSGKDAFGTHLAYTRQGGLLEPMYGNGTRFSAPRAKGSDDEEVRICPDMVWGDDIPEVEVRDMPGREQTVTLYPEELVCTYTYEVRNVTNLKHMAQMSGTLSGMAGEMTLADGRLGSACVTVPFESAVGGPSSVVGRFYTFGHHPDNVEPHLMVFYVVMDDGVKYCFKDRDNLDVTAQVHSAPDRRHVHIVIDGLELPQPIENGHGFRPAVDDWDEVKQEIVM